MKGVSLDANGGLQIIHATEEQLAQLQQSHQIHFLEDGQVMSNNENYINDMVWYTCPGMKIAILLLLYKTKTNIGNKFLALSLRMCQDFPTNHEAF